MRKAHLIIPVLEPALTYAACGVCVDRRQDTLCLEQVTCKVCINSEVYRDMVLEIELHHNGSFQEWFKAYTTKRAIALDEIRREQLIKRVEYDIQKTNRRISHEE